MAAKTKAFIVSAFKEGSFSIITLTISTIIVLALNPNPFINELFRITYIIGFMLSFATIIFRIILNQYVICRLRLDKLKGDLENDNYTDLTKDTLQTALKPLMKEVLSALNKRIKKETPGEPE